MIARSNAMLQLYKRYCSLISMGSLAVERYLQMTGKTTLFIRHKIQLLL